MNDFGDSLRWGMSGAAVLALSLATCVTARAETPAFDDAVIQEYLAFLALPNDAANRDDILTNARFVQDMMARRGIASTLLYGTNKDVPPAIYGEVKTPGATKTIIFYAHYDGQAVSPDRWAPGLSPYRPSVISGPIEQGGTVLGPWTPGAAYPKGWRIAARSAADDKAGVMVALNAFRTLSGSAAKPGVNVKFFFEGEEEKGSPHLADILRAHRGRLNSDLWVMVDGPRHNDGFRTMVLGVRGVVDIGITVYGPNRPLHAGNYGNWAPNPAQRLAALIGSMKDDDGRVLIPGFYDGTAAPTEAERAEIARAPTMDATQRKLGIAQVNGGGIDYGALMMMPTLEITGLQAGAVDARSANVIATQAVAKIDMRVAKGNSIATQTAKLIRFIEARGYHVLDRDPTPADRAAHPRLARVIIGSGGYEAQRTPLEHPMALRSKQILERLSPDRLVIIPSVGGSLPLSIFERELGASVVTIPVVNADNNQHGENENVDPAFLAEGIGNIRAIMEDDFISG